MERQSSTLSPRRDHGMYKTDEEAAQIAQYSRRSKEFNRQPERFQDLQDQVAVPVPHAESFNFFK